MGQNDGGETAWSYGKRSDVYYQSVPADIYLRRQGIDWNGVF